MSKRFGRNQKRRMRQQIAEAENAVRLKNMQLISARSNRDVDQDTIWKLVGEIDRAKKILGHEFIGFKLNDQVRYHLDHAQERFNHIPMQSLDSIMQAPPSSPLMPYKMEVIKHLPMDVIAASVDQEIYRQSIHVTVTVGPELKAHTAISGDSLRRLPTKVMANMVIDHIYKDIFDQIENLKGKR